MFFKAVKHVTIAGLQLRLDPSWGLVAGLMIWSLAQGYFPSMSPGLPARAYVTGAAVATLGVFACLLLHEMAHAFVARRLGLPVPRVTLYLFGGVAELAREPTSARGAIWVALAGPAASLCLALGFWSLAQWLRLDPQDGLLTALLSCLARINLALALLNMMPAYPLDGGRVLRVYLWHRSGDLARATKIAALSGALLASALMGLGLAALFQEAIFAGIWQMLIGGVLWQAARAPYQHQLAQSVFHGKTVRALMSKTPVTVSPEMTLSDFVNRVMLHHHIRFAPVLDQGVLLGHMDQTLLAKIDQENWSSIRIGDVFAALHTQEMIAPDMALKDLMQVMVKTGQRKFMVTESHHLVGVITLADVLLSRHRAERRRSRRPA